MNIGWRAKYILVSLFCVLVFYIALSLTDNLPKKVADDVLRSAARTICVKKVKDPSRLEICIAHQAGMLREHHGGRK